MIERARCGIHCFKEGKPNRNKTRGCTHLAFEFQKPSPSRSEWIDARDGSSQGTDKEKDQAPLPTVHSCEWNSLPWLSSWRWRRDWDGSVDSCAPNLAQSLPRCMRFKGRSDLNLASRGRGTKAFNLRTPAFPFIGHLFAGLCYVPQIVLGADWPIKTKSTGNSYSNAGLLGFSFIDRLGSFL